MAMCASGRYNESQTTGRVLRRLWFFHFHINLKYRLNLDMEEKLLPAIVSH